MKIHMQIKFVILFLGLAWFFSHGFLMARESFFALCVSILDFNVYTNDINLYFLSVEKLHDVKRCTL